MDTLNKEQQALLASIMNNSSQNQTMNTMISVQKESAPAPSSDANRLLSQAEIDTLIASMVN